MTAAVRRSISSASCHPLAMRAGAGSSSEDSRRVSETVDLE